MRRWIYRYTSPISPKRRDMGLGLLEVRSLADTKRKTLELHKFTLDGIDPIDQRNLAWTELLGQDSGVEQQYI
jgi:hypothetical protein